MKRRPFRSGESGSMTIQSIVVILLTLAVGGLAVDASNAWRARAVLQATADAAAHSAVVRMSEPVLGESPTAAALNAVSRALDTTTTFEDALLARDVRFGYVADDGSFNEDVLRREAVKVGLFLAERNDNPEKTYLLSLLGLDYWNIGATSVARLQYGGVRCPNPLLSVQARVETDSPIMYAGVCVMAAAGVTYGIAGSAITPEAVALIDAVAASAIGLDQSGDISSPWQDRQLRPLIYALVDSATATVAVDDFDLDALTPGDTIHVTCTDTGVLYLPRGSVLRNVILLSDCPVKFSAEVSLEASVVLGNLRLMATSDPSVSVTKDDESPYSQTCAPRGGLLLLVYVDADGRAQIPALADSDSPLGAYLDERVENGGTLMSSTLDTGGETVSDLNDALVEEVNETTDALGVDRVCLGSEIMASGETVTLAVADPD